MSLPAVQKALVIQEPLAPLTLQTVPVPKPGEGEVLVKVMSVGLNPGDHLRHRLNQLIPEYPAILGNDIAGVVVAVGEGVHGWKVGDEVFAGPLGGGYQQHALIPAAILIRKPTNVTFDDVATLPIAFGSACIGLFAPAPIGLGLNPTFTWEKPIHQGKSALIISAGTSVGQFVVQLLKLLGFTRITAYASAVHTEYLTSIGVTSLIDRASTPVTDLPSLVEPTDVVFDCLYWMPPQTSPSVNVAWDCARKDGGQVVTVNFFATLDRPADAANVEVVRLMGCYWGPNELPRNSRLRTEKLFGVTEAHSKFGKLMIRHLPEMLEKRAVVGARVEVLPNGLSGVIDGLERWDIEGGVSGVKLVAHPQESL